MVPSGVAVMAAVRTAAIGVESPFERHAFHGVERRSTADFLITRRVGPTLRLGERSGATGLYAIGDVTSGGSRSAKVEKKWGCFHSELQSFDKCSP